MRRRAAVLVAITTVGLGLVGCGDDGGGGSSSGSPTTSGTAGAAPPTTELPALAMSSPFRVGTEPDGLALGSAGVGTTEAEWGSDSFGTDEPVTVLAPGGDVTDPGIVVVSVTGYVGYQGGLGQASDGYQDEDLVRHEVDGREALYVPPGHGDDGAGWADLVAVRDEEADLAVRVTSPDASVDELIAIEQAVVTAGRERGPLVPEPPAGLEVVGSASVDAVLAARAQLPDPQFIPGTPRTHMATWTDGEVVVGVATVADGGLDPAAVAGLGPSGGHPVEVDLVDAGGPDPATVAGFTFLRAEDEAVTTRVLGVATEWGDTLVVTATVVGDGFGGDPAADALPSVDDLAAIAWSVTQADQATWDAFVATAPA